MVRPEDGRSSSTTGAPQRQEGRTPVEAVRHRHGFRPRRDRHPNRPAGRIRERRPPLRPGSERLLGVRGGSVFPAPVRPALGGASYADACERSRNSAPDGKAISKQTFAICGKIAEVDCLLRARPGLRDIVREVHPEVCFCEITGSPMPLSKRKRPGRDSRKHILRGHFPNMDDLLEQGRNSWPAGSGCPRCRRCLLVGAATRGWKGTRPDRAGSPRLLWTADDDLGLTPRASAYERATRRIGTNQEPWPCGLRRQTSWRF